MSLLLDVDDGGGGGGGGAGSGGTETAKTALLGEPQHSDYQARRRTSASSSSFSVQSSTAADVVEGDVQPKSARKRTQCRRGCCICWIVVLVRHQQHRGLVVCGLPQTLPMVLSMIVVDDAVPRRVAHCWPTQSPLPAHELSTHKHSQTHSHYTQTQHTERTHTRARTHTTDSSGDRRYHWRCRLVLLYAMVGAPHSGTGAVQLDTRRHSDRQKPVEREVGRCVRADRAHRAFHRSFDPSFLPSFLRLLPNTNQFARSLPASPTKKKIVFGKAYGTVCLFLP